MNKKVEILMIFGMAYSLITHFKPQIIINYYANSIQVLSNL